MNAVTLIVHGPLGGATKRQPDVIHAITFQSGLDGCMNGRTVEAACGKKHVRFVSDGNGRVLLWPIRHKGPLTRCRECWIATGKKRPRQAEPIDGGHGA